MSDPLFLITGGGTGAKVAEAVVHLSAAGLAPSDVHILFIDTDSTNGNLQRAIKAGTLYTNLQEYPWSVDTTARQSKYNPFSSGQDVGTRLFATDLHLYQLTAPLSTVIEGGLDTAVGDDDDNRKILELFYDGEERTAKCDDGFRARPNLGCLHLTEHLNEALVRNEQAHQFLNALGNAASGAASPIPVVATASVFGGTGASMLPVIRDCVEQGLDRVRGTAVSSERLHWNAVKLLPHYQPKHREKSVDPDRFLLDTASALQFYSKVYRNGEREMYDGVYVLGSDRPGRNQVEPTIGSEDQSNPAYVEEFLAALAVLDAAEKTDDPTSDQVRLFMKDATSQSLKWGDLPHANNERLKEQMGYLLHLAAFHLRQGGGEELTKGMDRLLDEVTPDHLRQFGWYNAIIDPWASHAAPYENAGGQQRAKMIQDDSSLGSLTFGWMEDEVAEYFGRLLLWSETAMKSEGLSLVDYQNSDYAAIHQAMSSLDADDVNTIHTNETTQQISPEEDNAMVRTLRASLASMVRLHHNDVRVKVDVDQFELTDAKQRIPLAITPGEVQEALRRNGRKGVVQAHVQADA